MDEYLRKMAKSPALYVNYAKRKPNRCHCSPARTLVSNDSGSFCPAFVGFANFFHSFWRKQCEQFRIDRDVAFRQIPIRSCKNLLKRENLPLQFLIGCAMIYKSSGFRYAPLAQLDRVSGYGPEGQGFESLTACQENPDFL